MRTFLRTLALTGAAALTFAPAVEAQITKPPASPRCKMTQSVGFGEVSLDYGRPSVRGREIFGSMEAWGAVWRTGANGCSTITLSEDAAIGGESLKAGTYGLFTIPMEEGDWTLIFSNQTDLWGAGGYDPAKDALRLDVTPTKLGASHETLTIDFMGFHSNGAELFIAWADTRLAVPFMVDTDTKVRQEIDEKVRNAKGEVSPRSYFDAAMFLIEKEESLEEAAAWMDKAVANSPGAFWMMYQSAALAHKMGDNDKAKRVATEALAAAKASKRGDFGYGARIEELLKKLK